MAETLFLGQVDNAAAPASPAAELYYLSGSYGSSVGTDVPLLIETADVPPAGPGGRFKARRVLVPVRFAAACSLRVTVISDFVRTEAAVTRTYTSPAQEQEDVIEVPIARVLTTLRVRLEVVSRAGRVAIFTPSVVGMPVTTGTAFAVEAV